MAVTPGDQVQTQQYVGTIVGESTSREFRLAVAHEAIREQDIIAVDAKLRSTDPNIKEPERIRIWAKVQRIERLNPLFPSEAGHELAATQTSPFDTVLSLSREMVTAVCQVLGMEFMGDKSGGKLDHLRYPAQPASTAYRPESADIGRVVLGDLQKQQGRALDIAMLSNRREVNVLVDGHAIVTRHLAVLAMTGAGKSWTARRIIEQLAEKNYPIVIFDPHGDYSRLAEVATLKNKVRRYHAQFPVFEQESETVAKLVGSLGYDELTGAMYNRFSDLFHAAKTFAKILTPNSESDHEEEEILEHKAWLEEAAGENASTYGIRPDMWLIAHLAAAGERALQDNDSTAKQRLKSLGWNEFDGYDKRDIATVRGIKARTRSAAAALWRMEQTNRRGAADTLPLPTDYKELVRYGGISVISLAGYTRDFQATIYSIIAEKIFEARTSNDLKLPVLFLLEEAHNFVPDRAYTTAEQRATMITRQIAQEGRKFSVGLILISQRPSRLDETTLSQCNSFVIMRMVNPADQNFVRRVIETLGEDEANLLPDLDVGEAILSGQLINFPVLVRIKPPESQGEREEEDAFVSLEKIHDDMPR